jgi:hypothetical protein
MRALLRIFVDHDNHCFVGLEFSADTFSKKYSSLLPTINVFMLLLVEREGYFRTYSICYVEWPMKKLENFIYHN